MMGSRVVRWCWVLVVATTLGGCASSTSPSSLPPGIDPKDPLAAMTLMQQGQALMAEGRPDAAIERFEMARSLQPTNPTVHNILGVAELRRRNPQAALEAFNRALNLAPSYSDARNNRGAAYSQLKQFSMAESDFLAVLSDSTYSNRAGVLFNLGSLYLTRGNLAAAEENLRRATASGGPVDAYLMLAQVEEKLGRMELAEKAYLEAGGRAPGRPDVSMGLARFYEGQGRHKEAAELYRKILAQSPNSPEAQEVRARQGK